MRNLKKFLALVLAMMMTLSLMVTVNAKNVEFDDGESVNDAFIDDLTVLAGIRGPCRIGAAACEEACCHREHQKHGHYFFLHTINPPFSFFTGHSFPFTTAFVISSGV